MNKFKLGPVQEMWLNNLEKYPERQGKNILGEGTPYNYKACCLGEYLICYHTLINNNVESIFNEDGIIHDNNLSEQQQLGSSYKILGLFTPMGNFKDVGSIKVGGNHYRSLAAMNDGSIDNQYPPLTWPKIAEIIRENPEKVFNKSV